jgi:hypothetical protein
MRKGDVLFMNMHQKHELSLFAEELYRYMSPATLNQLSYRSRRDETQNGSATGIIFIFVCMAKSTSRYYLFTQQ